jgi:hypothetical protein
MHFHLVPQFPNSLHDNFYKTSEQTWDYNCIAWAYGINNKWLWPIRSSFLPNAYWPPTIPAIVHINSFIELFKEIGYEVCDNDQLENGFEKVAIFEKNNTPTHAAKQLPDGLWSSKLGPFFDATHTLNCTDGGEYGQATVFMRRPL